MGNGTRLVSGIRELLITDGTTLEDLHMVATEVVLHTDKVLARTVRKLKFGQKIRFYDECSNKEYGVAGSDMVGFFKESYSTKTSGQKLKVYDPTTLRRGAPHEWSIPADCLLEVFAEFDPDSPEGKKAAVTASVAAKPKRRGRRPKRADSDTVDWSDAASSGHWNPDDYEKEEDGEEYDFTNSDDYEEYFEE